MLPWQLLHCTCNYLVLCFSTLRPLELACLAPVTCRTAENYPAAYAHA